jgi:hypothetical protein
MLPQIRWNYQFCQLRLTKLGAPNFAAEETQRTTSFFPKKAQKSAKFPKKSPKTPHSDTMLLNHYNQYQRFSPNIACTFRLVNDRYHVDFNAFST